MECSPLRFQGSVIEASSEMTATLFDPEQRFSVDKAFESDFLTPVLGYYSQLNGKLISLPFNASTPVLYYNQDILDEVGIKKIRFKGNFRQLSGWLGSNMNRLSSDLLIFTCTDANPHK